MLSSNWRQKKKKKKKKSAKGTTYCFKCMFRGFEPLTSIISVNVTRISNISYNNSPKQINLSYKMKLNK